MMGVYLALDAGGTKTECVIANQERVLARATSETVKIMAVGASEATNRVRSLLKETSDAAGIPLYLITRACMGLAGIGHEGVREWAQATLGELVPGADLLLTGDEDIALDAAFGTGPGILVIAGPSSNVIGRCSDGSRMTAGGWGPMLGDEGSGFWIGLEAIRSSLRALDRGVPTCVLREIGAFWHVSGIGALLAKANSQPRPDFAALATVVAQCAAKGDPLAKSVLERAGQELAAQVGIVVSKMRAAGCSTADANVVGFTGTVLSHFLTVRETMQASLRLSHPRISLQDRATQPIEGALARARHG